MRIKLGSEEGNSGAIIRWGKYLDNGLWIRLWRFRQLWCKWRILKGYLNFGLFVFKYGN